MGEVLERTIPSDVTADRLLSVAIDIGEAMLRNGAEVHRVEDTISRLCGAYGSAKTEIFVIPTVIIAALTLGDGTRSSQIRRVSISRYRMYKIELYNNISRKACEELPSLETLEGMVREAKTKRGYPLWLITLGAAVGTGAFAVFFGGTWRDGIVAAIIGAVLALLERLQIRKVNDFAQIAIQCFIAGVLAYALVLAGIGQNVDKIMIGTIMYSIPGLAFGIAVRDLFYGDFFSGALKIIHSCLVSLMVAFGYVLAMLVFSGVAI